MTPAIIWSFGAGVWFSKALYHIWVSRKARPAVFAALMAVFSVAIALTAR